MGDLSIFRPHFHGRRYAIHQYSGKERLFNLLASLPVAAGLIVGIIAMIKRYPSRKLEWICLILGTLGCAAIVLSLVTG